jgi:hypothetical protein
VRVRSFATVICLGLSAAQLAAAALAAEQDPEGFALLFAADGVPAGWHAAHWSDVSRPPPDGAKWKVEQGVLHGSTPRGTWLVSDREYGDFVLAFEFKLGEQGNSGVGLRFPAHGDPAFDGLEVQMVDPRYYGADGYSPAQLTASLYPVFAPSKQVYQPNEWNRCEITCRGPRVAVSLNGELVQQLDLDGEGEPLARGAPLKARPRRGHVGFQELSRGGSHVQIRNARLKVLDR